MIRCSSEEAAKSIAEDRGLAYGWSVFSSGWYVGTRAQLRGIGVLDPK